MRKAIRLAALLLIFPSLMFGQSRQANTWILGYPSGDTTMWNTERFGGMFMKFADKTYSIEKFDISGGPASAVANDTAGNLLFYYNGCSIYNNQHQIMENGDGVNVGDADHDYYCNSIKGIFYIRSGNLALQKPKSETMHYLFHLRGLETSDTSFVFDRLLYSEIDMGSGLGKVVQKNQTLVADSLQDAVAAVRHGNGRDWWMVIPRGTNRQFWKILLTPNGVSKPQLQTLPPPFSPFTAKFRASIDVPPWEIDVVPNEYGFESWAGQATFSPDGTKYCRIIKAGDIEIYDFDRCTGEMKLRRLIPVPPYIHYPEIPLGACGLAVSPNSRFLYFNNNEALYQFDMCDEMIENGNYELIEEWDRSVQDSISVAATNFFQMRNAPDGKIYMAAGNSMRALHVIHEPNKNGKACRFEQRGVQLPRWTDWIINYFPNFDLYDLHDSPCDTLGIDDPNPPEPGYTFEDFKIFPNPTDQEVKLYAPDCEGLSVEVWNIMGQLVKEIPFLPGKTAYSMDVSNWAAGAYFVVARIDSRKPVTQKLIVTH